MLPILSRRHAWIFVASSPRRLFSSFPSLPLEFALNRYLHSIAPSNSDIEFSFLSIPSMSTSLTELVEYTRSLEKAVTLVDNGSGGQTYADRPRALDLLGALDRIEKVTADDLRTTKVGLLIGKLAKSIIDTEIAASSKSLLAKWKSMMGIGSAAASTPVELAKSNLAAKSASKTSNTATSTPSKKEDDKDKKRNKDGKVSEDDDRDSKKRKTSASPPTPSATSTSASTDLSSGPFALGQTGDSLRDKMQTLLYQALGEPPASILPSKDSLDLSAYKVSSTISSSPTIQPVASPSPSPPPISQIHLSDSENASKDGAEAKTAENASSPTSSASTADASATSSSTSAAASSTTNTAAKPAAPIKPLPTFHSRQELAFTIEEAMHKKFLDSNSSGYKQKYRDIAPQLRDNIELKESLFLGHMTPDALVAARTTDLASSQLKEKREKEAAYAREAARSDNAPQAASDMFQCDMCKGWSCTYFQMQVS